MTTPIRTACAAAAAALLFSCSSAPEAQSPEPESLAGYANPFIGTAYHGHTFPGACVPFGMVQASPDTGVGGWRYCSGYNYEDSEIIRFSQTHLNGTGVGDLGDAAIMPFDASQKTENFKSSFSKKSERASPGHYEVFLDDAKASVEISATERAAIYRIRYGGPAPRLLADFRHGVTSGRKTYHSLSSQSAFETPSMLTGSRKPKMWVEREVFYALEFSRPVKSAQKLEGDPGEGAGEIYAIDFGMSPGDELIVKIGLSSVSVEGAKANLAAEIPGWDFDAVRDAAGKRWEDVFSRVRIGGDRVQKENFYTSLYHLFIQPNNIADVDGRYRGADGRVASSPTGRYFTTFSLWDTFRAAHPFYTIAAPDAVADFANSMLLHFDAAGRLPIWTLWGVENYCMIANHSIPVLAEAVVKGIPVDAKRAFEAAKKSSEGEYRQSNWPLYEKLGYFPFDKTRGASVARTLESAYDDHCVSILAKAAGDEEQARRFAKRAMSYKNLFDRESGFMRGRDSSGAWREPFSPFAFPSAGGCGRDYIEGNALQYTWHVQHDEEGLMGLFGGAENFANALSKLFEMPEKVEGAGFAADVTGLIGQYAHGNEPSHHVAYLFAVAGRPWRTQELVREICDKFYQNRPDGLCGNDDCGQMSAWYAFSALGFYPLDPASGEYVLGAPQVPSAKIDMGGGKTFEMTAKNLSEKNKYVGRVLLDGKPLESGTISHSDLLRGASLVFEMTDSPSGK